MKIDSDDDEVDFDKVVAKMLKKQAVENWQNFYKKSLDQDKAEEEA